MGLVRMALRAAAGVYVTVAIEANGNLTAAHRETGRLVLFAPDHSFDGVTPFPG
ncbi:hypothetical protein GCM10010178_01530 [Lentzea flava]|uniref:Uncharacterized protein n=1 Tax=Lentzea flava TaxID=103732 RepID=A0ABQ2U976_9PSEU|nr:hypothetical protein GCM10010178_01530 [Lentzea flava]